METTAVRAGGIDVGAGERIFSAMAGTGLIAYGLAQRSVRGVAVALLGGAWLGRGITGRSRLYRFLGTRGPLAVELRQSTVIQRPRHEVYEFWRNVRNHPRFMSRVESVEPLSEGKSRWRARGMIGRPIEWVSVTRNERENELVAWSSLGGQFEHSGEARFTDAPGDRGTLVQVTLRYRSPGGRPALAVARLLGDEPNEVLAEELRRLKQLLETGEIATVAGQPRGPRTLAGRAMTRRLGEEPR